MVLRNISIFLIFFFRILRWPCKKLRGGNIFQCHLLKPFLTDAIFLFSNYIVYFLIKPQAIKLLFDKCHHIIRHIQWTGIVKVRINIITLLWNFYLFKIIVIYSTSNINMYFCLGCKPCLNGENKMSSSRAFRGWLWNHQLEWQNS